MRETQVKSITALARGLRVLRILQSAGPATLHQLHERSSIPKASLLRILKTLHESGMVWQRMADGAYVPSFSLTALASRIDQEHALVETASPTLKALSDDIKWPSVLAVPRLTHMEVIETNVRGSYFSDVPLGPVGFRVNMLRSASGRAYVAFCDDPAREAILEKLRVSTHKGDRQAHNPLYVDKLLRETRAAGYGLRDPDFGGDFNEERSTVDDERDSLGVPIRVGNHVPGVINVTWSRRAMDRSTATQRLAGPALAAAAEIADRISGG